MSNLLQQGLVLMVVGMSVTFFFLGLLVFCTSVMSRIVQKTWPEEASPVHDAGLGQDGRSEGQGPVDERTLSIIKKAIHLHRNKG